MKLGSALRALRRLGILLRLAWPGRALARSRGEEDRALAHRALSDLLGQAGGISLKVGQTMASTSGTREFDSLIDGIEPRPLFEMRPVLEQAYGVQLDTVFTHLDKSAAAASLSQVHRGQLADGSEVAVKVRYPEIHTAVEMELRVAGLTPGVGAVKRFGFDLGSHKRLFKRNMDRELDYLSEAHHQQRFRSQLEVPGLAVPRAFLAACRKQVLVQSWEDGVRLADAASWPKRDRLALARTLMSTLFASFFVLGEIHADPNPGNYFVRR